MELRFCEQDIEIFSREIVKKVCEALSEQSLYQSQKFLTPEELASFLSVPKSWVYEHTRNKTSGFPFIKIGKYIRFSLPDVLTWLSRNHEKS